MGGGMKTRANGRSKARRDARPAWKLHRRLKRGDARRRSFAFPQFHTPPKKTLCARRLTRGRGALAPLLPRSTLRRSRPFWRRRAWARHRFGRARWSATRRVPLRCLGGSVLRLRRAPPRSARARRRGDSPDVARALMDMWNVSWRRAPEVGAGRLASPGIGREKQGSVLYRFPWSGNSSIRISSNSS